MLGRRESGAGLEVGPHQVKCQGRYQTRVLSAVQVGQYTPGCFPKAGGLTVTKFKQWQASVGALVWSNLHGGEGLFFHHQYCDA